MSWPSEWPEDRWDVPDPAALDVSPGPDTTLCTDPPREMPARRSAGFTADLEVVTECAGEQTGH